MATERTEEHAAGQDRLLTELADRSLRQLPRLADQLVDRVWGEPYTRHGPVPKDDLWHSCHDNLGGMLMALRGNGPSPEDLLDAARATGTRRAHQHCPLDWVLHAWRVGGQIMWTDFAERTGSDDAGQLQELVNSAAQVWGVTERFSIEMAATYQNLERQLLGAADQHMMSIMDALLDGRAAEVRTEAEHALKMRQDSRVLVVTAEDAGPRPVSPGKLAATLEEHGVRSEWRLRAGCQVGIVVGDQLPASRIAAILDGLATARIGVSPALDSLADVPSGYRMAMLAMTTMTAGRTGAEALDDCLPDALMLSSPELADRVVTVTFGQVLALPRAERDELLETVSAWINSLGSTLNAAKLLYCHRNTVLNRLRRVESLTSLDLGDVATWPQVILALSNLRREHGKPSSG